MPDATPSFETLQAIAGKAQGTSPDAQSVPLSCVQQRLWFLNQLAPQASFAHISCVIPFSGPFQQTALEHTLQAIVRRQAALRTTFTSHNNEPVQVVGPAFAPAVPLEDISQLSSDAQLASIRQLARQEAQQPFDLQQGPLFRCRLLRLAPEQHLLLVTIHQIISDEWSLDLFRKEVQTLYPAFAAGQRSPLAELPGHYADFVQWQHAWLQSEHMQAERDYWHAQLANVPPLLDLPTDFPRPAVQSFSRARLRRSLSADLSTALEHLSAQEDVTLFSTLLAAFQALLQRLSGQADILVATPTANRQQPETQEVIGCFENTLVLRATFSEHLTFRALLAQVRQTTGDADAHPVFPFEKLVEELVPDRHLSYTPLAQVLFTMPRFPSETHDTREPQASLLTEIAATGSQFDLTLAVHEQQGALWLEVTYNTDLFEQQRVARLLDQLTHLLVQITSNPDEQIALLSLVDPHSARLLPDPTAPIVPTWDGSIAEHLSQHARRIPDQIAVRDPQVAWTYRQLDRLSNRLAHYLRTHGVKPQEPVAIYGQRSAGLALALLGILKAGAAFIILDPDYPAARLIDCLELAQPKGWIQLTAAGACPQAVQQFVQQIACRIELSELTVESEQSVLRACADDDPGIVVEPDGVAYIAFTSGSTGKPKGIVGTHRPLSHFFQWYSATFALTETDRFTLLSGLSHDPLMRDVFTPFWLGATLCIPDAEDRNNPKRLGEWMAQQAVTVTHLTPALLQVLSSSGAPIVLSHLRLACFGGAVLTRRDVNKLRALAPSVTCVNFYGATETPQAMGHYIVPPQVVAATSRDLIPVGRGIQDVQLLVLNQQRRLAGVGETGEISIRTPYLARGYVGNPSLTDERFITNPFTQAANDRLYKSGDLGRYLPDGTLEILGRNDFQVKIRGFRIELGEIEATLTRHPAISEAVVLAREDTPGDQRLVAYLVARPDMEIAYNQVRAFLQDHLPEYMIPVVCVTLDALPLTPNGKLDRQALPRPEASGYAAEGDYVPPSLIEHYQLLEIWEALLGARPIGIKDNFFLLGGHSLLAASMLARIEEVFGKKLTLATLFTRPTIDDLTALLQQEEEEQTSRAPIYSIQPGGTKQPFFYMHGFVNQGGFYCYHLSRALGADQPFYALQPYRLEGLRVPPSFEEIAAAHIEAIRTVQPEGPYLLGGFCNGALVATEMTRQLQAQGQRVSLLVLIDPEDPAGIVRRLAREIIRRVGGWLRISQEHQLSFYLRFRSIYASILYARGRLGFTIPSLQTLTQPLDKLRQSWSRIYYWVMPGRIPPFDAARLVFGWKGHTTLEKGDWGKLAQAKGADIFFIPGEHLEWTSENIVALAEQISGYLKTGESAAPGVSALVSTNV